MSSVGPTAEWPDEARALRRFGMALARDNQWAFDESSAAALVDTLINSTLSARRDDAPRGLSGRSRLLSLFVRLYRRHVRLRHVQDGGEEPGGERSLAEPSAIMESATERAIRAMPFELREALLLVALERLSHVEAAAALEISLAALLERLERARTILAQRPLESTPARSRAPHLRLLK
jgi:DNA-directed RNA polymerase specialized sigma24 family protein